MNKKRYSSEAQDKLRFVRHKRWVEKALTIHQKKFSYESSFSSFTTAKGSKVKLACKEHDQEFSVYPDKHLQNKHGGCEKCQNDHLRKVSIEKSKKKFLPWFEKNCSDRLRISSEVGLLTEKIKVVCRIHNTEKEIEPTVLMTAGGFGCDLCVSEGIKARTRLTLAVVKKSLQGELPDIVSLKRIHFNEKKGQTELIFSCTLHGEQKPVTLGHAKRSSTVCLDCGKLNKGYGSYRLENLIKTKSKGRLTTLGIMEVEVFGIKGLKVGITTRSLKSRYSFYLREIFFSVQLYEKDALVLENQIKLRFSKHKDERIKKAGMRMGERWSGDTEIFWSKQKSKIISFINQFIKNLATNDLDYPGELDQMVIEVSPDQEIRRKKSTANLPISVVGVDPKTGKEKIEFSSLAEAQRAGYGNLSMVLSKNSRRRLSGRLRWFRKAEFDPDELHLPLSGHYHRKPIKCVETDEVFISTVEAEKVMRDRGHKVAASKISSVLNGRQHTAGGFSWKRVNPNSAEARKLLKTS